MRAEPESRPEPGAERCETAGLPIGMSVLDHRIEQVFDKLDQMEFLHGEVSDLIERLSGKLQAIEQRMDKALTEQTAENEATSVVETTMEAKDVDMVTETDAAMEATAIRLSKIEEKLAAFDVSLTKLAGLGETASTLAQSVADLTGQLQSGAAKGPGNDPDFSDLEQKIDAIPERIDLGGSMADIDARLSEIAGNIEAAGSGNETTEQLGAFSEQLTAVAAQVELMVRRPFPVLDLTAQHRGFATFNAAAGSFLQRLEMLVESIAAEFKALELRVAERLDAAPATETDAAPAPDNLVHAMAALAETNKFLIALHQEDAAGGASPETDVRNAG